VLVLLSRQEWSKSVQRGGFAGKDVMGFVVAVDVSVVCL